MQDRPDKDELLGVIEAFLREDVLPASAGRVRYHLLVALSLLGILRRELSAEPHALQREWDGLRALGVAGPGPEPNAAAVHTANERLCADIRAGTYDAGAERATLLAHLRRVVTDKLGVANPDFLARVQVETQGGREGLEGR